VDKQTYGDDMLKFK